MSVATTSPTQLWWTFTQHPKLCYYREDCIWWLTTIQHSPIAMADTWLWSFWIKWVWFVICLYCQTYIGFRVINSKELNDFFYVDMIEVLECWLVISHCHEWSFSWLQVAVLQTFSQSLMHEYIYSWPSWQ